MSKAKVLVKGLLLLALAVSSGIVCIAGVAGTAWAQQAGTGIEVVELPSAHSPLVSLRLQFNVGSLHDPAGKEGLAALTAAMITDAGTRKRSYTDLVEALYPMAAAIGGNTTREVTLIAGTIHRDKLADYTALLEEALLQPGFSQSDFDRNKEQLVAGLTNGLRSNDEALGLELLQDEIYQGHPYGHPSLGTVEGLKRITLDDVKAFYKQHYTQANLMLGVAGGYPQGYVAKLRQDLAALPPGVKSARDLPPAPKIEGRNFTLVEKQTGSVGIHFGFPLPITRADADYYPL
ncbi:MAG TPA: pitrilysin family protein, partial [Thermoanaerobaculia bacterium]|nr:pitrilysin family protein [Thermoanaerobaculia bacterium]